MKIELIFKAKYAYKKTAMLMKKPTKQKYEQYFFYIHISNDKEIEYIRSHLRVRTQLNTDFYKYAIRVWSLCVQSR